ncbi:MAG: HlyD family efflux transporter periplasmic adaptor subunit [Planctomycetaceae bacterium]|nr:HlyD family efflux transporter periplasmic adaptor subunit [Planctomycetaceae bacterium]
MSIGNLASNMLTSTQRPVPLQARPDLVIKRIQYMGATSVVVKDPVALKYFRFQPEQFAILQLLDGVRNLEEIRDEFHLAFPTVRITVPDVQNLVTDFHRSGLVYSNRTGQGSVLVKKNREEKRKKFFKALMNLLYIRLPGWDPERTLRVIYPWFKWMYSRWGVTICMLFVLSSWIVVGVQFQEFQSRLPKFQQFFGWPNLMYLWAVLAVSKVIHEFGHGLTCKHFQGECHEMGVLFLCLSPCLYCDVSDSWLLENKWQRIWIAAAGMYIEVILSAFAIWGWWYSREGLFHYLCLNLFFVSTFSTVVFNANPLMRYDGYYMLSDWLEIPNLRPKADKLLSEKFGWYCLGIEPRPDPFMPQTGQGWFVTFAIAAWLYRWIVMYSILLFFYTFLKPYELQSIGIALAFFSLVSMFGALFYKVYKMVKTPRVDPLSRPKMIISFAIFAAVVVGIMMIPIPWNLEAPLMVEPQAVKHVYAPVGGSIVNVLVKPGQKVVAGDLLVVLRDKELEAQLKSLESQLEVKKAELRTRLAVRDRIFESFVKEEIAGIQKQIAEVNHKIDLMSIRAPIAGSVVAAPRVPEPKLDIALKHLSPWFGSPLEPRNIDAVVQPATHLLSIAPNDKYQVVMMIDQSFRNDFTIGLPVRIKIDHLANQTYRGKITEVSLIDSKFAPQPLTNKTGGDMATVTDDQGRERLDSAAYQATVTLDQDLDLLRTGVRGRARYTVMTRSLGQWIYRYLRQTFHFRL